MKIAILTSPPQINYGGILQNYAVQQLLKDRGHEVITLDTGYVLPKPEPFLRQMYLFAASTVLYCLGRSKTIIWPYDRYMHNFEVVKYSMRPLLHRFLHISPRLETDDEIESYCQQESFDAYVVGSDQVWRPKFTPHIDWSFLSFLPADYKVKRIALAASFGISEWEFSDEQTSRFLPLIRKFDSISVREDSGVALCKERWGVDAVVLVDPTLMLTPDRYDQIVQLDYANTHSVRHKIFVYQLDDTEEIQLVETRVRNELHCEVEHMTATAKKYGPYATEKTALKCAPATVAQWLRAFKEADFVITDSFHGTVFSILYHKPFVTISNNDRGTSRMETLLKTFKLENRLICDKSQLSEIKFNDINWDTVDKILNDRRALFNRFLINALCEPVKQ